MELGYFSRTAREDSPHRHFGSLAAMAEWCDVLIVILPGGEATRGIVNAEVLQALGPNGWFVNVSRGTTVDEGALLQPVLEDPRRPPVQQPRREDREHARVRVRERLARAVRVEQAQRHGRDPVRRAGDEARAFLEAGAAIEAPKGV